MSEGKFSMWWSTFWLVAVVIGIIFLPTYMEESFTSELQKQVGPIGIKQEQNQRKNVVGIGEQQKRADSYKKFQQGQLLPKGFELLNPEESLVNKFLVDSVSVGMNRTGQKILFVGVGNEVHTRLESINSELILLTLDSSIDDESWILEQIGKFNEDGMLPYLIVTELSMNLPKNLTWEKFKYQMKKEWGASDISFDWTETDNFSNLFEPYVDSNFSANVTQSSAWKVVSESDKQITFATKLKANIIANSESESTLHLIFAMSTIDFKSGPVQVYTYIDISDKDSLLLVLDWINNLATSIY